MWRWGSVGSGLRLTMAVGATVALMVGQGGLALASSSNGQGGQNSQSQGYQGIMYYTRFVTPTYPSSNYGGSGDPVNVKSVTFQYTGTNFSLSAPTDVSTVPAADGIAFTPSGDLLVGGQFSGNVYDVDPATGQLLSTTSAGTPAAFMIGLSPDGSTAYVGSVGDNSGGHIGVVGLTPNVHQEGTITVTGPDPNVDSIAFVNGQAYYTSGLPDGYGNFGTIDLQTGQETRLLSGKAYAHGMVYDPATNDLILTGTARDNLGQNVSQIGQINPTLSTSEMEVSVRTVDLPGNGYLDTFDLPWTDGQGHVFAAANDGNLTFVDYSKTGLVGDPTNFVQTVYVDSYLDDIIGSLAQMSGPQFVIWGANRSDNQQIALGGDYNFWGHSWWKQIDSGNPGGTVPDGVARFKGFADQAGSCGSQWTALPGNSSNPPEIMGNYVSVIVTTNMSKSGSTTSGNIKEIVILKVDNPNAYKDDPGHVMTGQMVGIVCQS